MKKYDVIVVGGGIIGKSIALKLSEGNLNILCIDPYYKSNGSASYAAGAMLGAFGEITADKTSEMDELEINFRVEAQKFYPTWLNKIREKSKRDIYTKAGTFLIANVAGKQDHINLSKISSELKLRDESYEWVEPSKIPNFQPNREYLAYQALYLPNEGSVNTTDLIEAITEALSCANVEFMDQTVTSVLINGRTACGVVISGETIHADHVVLCAGVGIQKIVDESNLNTGVPHLMPGKGVSMVASTDLHFEHVIRTPNRDFACGTHIVPRSESTVYIGATNRISNSPGLKDGVTAGEIHSLLHSAVHEINTNFRTANIERLFYGSRPITTDRFPVVGETEIQGLYIATGTYRNGILMSPLIGEIVGSRILGTESSFENPFSVQNRRLILNDISSDRSSMISNGIRDLVSFIQEPTGRLPYNRTQELEDFVSTLVEMVLHNNGKYQQLVEESRDLINKYPLAEIIPQLFYKYHEVKQGERTKKYVSR